MGGGVGGDGGLVQMIVIEKSVFIYYLWMKNRGDFLLNVD